MRIYLAHGASGSVATMRPWIAALRQRGLDARAVGLPKGSAERALPVYRQLIEHDAAAGKSDPAVEFVIGGHSFGGRVASMMAAERPLAGLVLLSYPLHRPGRPEQVRVEHWPRIECPVLLLSGEADPFARIGLLRELVQSLANAELVTYPGVRHGLTPVLVDAVGQISAFVDRLAARPAGPP